MEQSLTPEAPRRTKNLAPLALWTLGWLASLALAKFGPGWLWHSSLAISWAALIVNLAVGVGWIVAHARYLRRVDELQRKITIDALALALGAGLVGGLAYSVANSVGLVSFDDIVVIFCIVISAVYVVATVVGNLRYR